MKRSPWEGCIFQFWTPRPAAWAGGLEGVGGVSKKITSQRLLDQSQAGVYRRKCHIPPHFWPFWAYSRTLPQGVELLVEPLVKSLFCPINASPNEFLVRNPPPDPHHLKHTFLSF